jgi:hypothetical protein
MASTKDVLDHHLKCFGERNLGGILSDYAPAAVLFTTDGPLRGVDAIRPLFQALIAEFGKPGAIFSMKQQFVEGRLCLHSVDRGDRRQRVRDGHGHVRRAGRQDRGPVIHRQDYAQGLKTLLHFWRPPNKPIKLTGYTGSLSAARSGC